MRASRRWLMQAHPRPCLRERALCGEQQVPELSWDEKLTLLCSEVLAT